MSCCICLSCHTDGTGLLFWTGTMAKGSKDTPTKFWIAMHEQHKQGDRIVTEKFLDGETDAEAEVRARKAYYEPVSS